MPSPNLPTLDSAIVYPGAVLIEGTRLSEGRGTTRPFELIGAPWIDGDRLADAMNAKHLPGVHFRAAFFEPTFQKHAKQTCGGCQLHVLDRRNLPTGPDDGRVDRRIPRAESGALRVARTALRVRARKAADRHSVRIRSTPDRRSTRAAASRRWWTRGRRTKTRSAAHDRDICSTDCSLPRLGSLLRCAADRYDR